MAIICPTIMPLTGEADEFDQMMNLMGPLASRLQIDLMDGQFAPNHNTDPQHVWWPEEKLVDIHLMYSYPEEALRVLLAKQPNIVIIHAEAKGDLPEMMRLTQEAGVKAGVAILRSTPVEDAKELIAIADHVLLFGGELGGDGQAELAALDKVPEVREIRPDIEIGWDGGANENNVSVLVQSGIDVINVGGALRKSEDPAETYSRLTALVS